MKVTACLQFHSPETSTSSPLHPQGPSRAPLAIPAAPLQRATAHRHRLPLAHSRVTCRSGVNGHTNTPHLSNLLLPALPLKASVRNDDNLFALIRPLDPLRQHTTQTHVHRAQTTSWT
ncbi:hypothetical protein VTO73DRAFT_6985 [Trametes versicolor]